jgi:hypothetical protein
MLASSVHRDGDGSINTQPPSSTSTTSASFVLEDDVVARQDRLLNKVFVVVCFVLWVVTGIYFIATYVLVQLLAENKDLWIVLWIVGAMVIISLFAIFFLCVICWDLCH